MYPIITIDYEIFGDGTGGILETVVDPMDRIRKVCDRYGYKVVVFFEVAEYIAMKHRSEKDQRFGRELKRMEDQLRLLHEEGHDIQLHYHPQFVGSSYKDGRFVVDGSAFTFEGLLKGDPDPKGRISGLLKEGIDTIDDLLGRKGGTIAFRAGGWNLTPAHVMIPVLKRLGIRIDSSGVKGAMMRSDKHSYDYRRMHARTGPWWTGPDSIDRVGPAGRHLMEMPIYSKHMLPIDPRKFLMLRRGTRLAARHTSGSTSSGRLDLNAIYYAMVSDVKWDFCKMDARSMWDLYREAGRGAGPDASAVMIGHTKEYANDREFDLFLGKVAKEGSRFFTFTDVNDLLG